MLQILRVGLRLLAFLGFGPFTMIIECCFRDLRAQVEVNDVL